MLNKLEFNSLYIKNFWVEYLYALSILLLYLGVGYIARIFILKYKTKFEKLGKLPWHDFCKSLANPLCFFFLFVGLFSGIDHIKIFHKLMGNLTAILSKSTLVLCLFWFAISYLITYEKRLYHNRSLSKIAGFDKRAITTVTSLGKLLIILLTGMFIMDIWGVDIRGLLTVTGIGTAALAFASQGLLSNFFGAIIIFIDKPFSLGDWIKLSNGKEGKVENIGWRVTKIRTYDTHCVYIANSVFSDMVIENYSKRTHRTISRTIKLKATDIKKLESITKEIKDMIAKFPSIDNRKEIDCVISDFKETYVNCKINAFTTTTKRLEFLQLEEQIMFALAKITSKYNLFITTSN